MYISRSPVIKKESFPPNYNGNLLSNSNYSRQEACEKNKDELKRYKFKKNTALCYPDKFKNNKTDIGFSNDEIILIGLIVFLYVGCEHSKENLILMGVLAYLLIGCQDN